MMKTPWGKLLLGGVVESGARTEKPLHYDRHHLTTHGVIVGMTGSGKTGLGVVLLEEVLRQGVPALILDPKGDMGNLLLNFPELRPADFEPWVDAGEAQRKDVSVAQLASTTADRWQQGLADWSLKGEDVGAVSQTAELKIWTPGSTAGAPMNVVGSLRAPEGDFEDDPEGLRAEIESFVSSLLLLADLDADPISSREHILLSHLIEKSWRAGRDLTLAELITQVAAPPIRRLGVFDLDEFFPEKQRVKLAMRLNGLVASPSFATWMRGEALDLQTLLYAEDGRPRASVVYLPHLAEEQRQFVVTLILSKVVTWMRKQPGTSDLRALIYMDEVYGFAPPSRNPPSKKPILTLLKQARAHGVGMVLSTQNPVDLDYKTMSNAGTWMIGRLSTERDKARILEALRSATEGTDVAELDKVIGALGKRQFLLLGARQPTPVVFTTRWALSFLRGPLTRAEVRRLRDDSPEEARVAARGGRRVSSGTHAVELLPAERGAGGRAAALAGHSTAAQGNAPALGAAAQVSRGDASDVWLAQTPREGARRATRITPARVSFPRVAAGVPVHFLNPSAPWARSVGADPHSDRWEAAVIARVQLRFGVVGDAQVMEEWEAVAPLVRSDFVAARALAVDWDDRDLRGDAPTAAVVIRPAAAIEDPAWWAGVRGQLQAHLDAQRTVEIMRNTALELASRLGEDRDAFAARCREAAAKRADREAAERSQLYARKMNAWRNQLEATSYKIDQAEAKAAMAMATAEELEAKATLLAGTLKGQLRARDVAVAVAKRKAAEAKRDKAQQARGRVDKAWADLAALEAQLGAELTEIHRKWLATATDVTQERVTRQAEVHLEHVGLLWMPVRAQA